jgi:hypothetical protein
MLSKMVVGEHNLTADHHSFTSLSRLHTEPLLALGLIAKSVKSHGHKD